MSETSTTAGALYGALAKAAAACESVGKDATNTFHRYKYASAESIYAEARGPMAAHGLSLVPLTEELHGDGEHGYQVRVAYRLCHSSGESLALSRQWPVVPDKGRPLDKALAAALTTCLAYLVRDLLMLPRVDEEVDRREDRHEREEADVRAPKQPEPTGQAAAPKGSGTTIAKPAPKVPLDLEVARQKAKEAERAAMKFPWGVQVAADVRQAWGDVGRLMEIVDKVGAALAANEREPGAEG